MTNQEYTTKTLSKAKRIIVDTSALMNPGFRQFVEKYKQHIIDRKQKITVPKTVRAEIAHHFDSEYPNKKDSAWIAYCLIAENVSVFEIEAGKLTDDEVNKPFADPNLFNDLSVHNRDCVQLLITNDKDLSADVSSLNNRRSYRGKKIFVCYINQDGDLQNGTNPDSKTDLSREKSSPEKQTVKDIHANCPADSVKKKESPWRFDIKSALLTFTIGGILCGIIKLIKKLFKTEG